MTPEPSSTRTYSVPTFELAGRRSPETEGTLGRFLNAAARDASWKGDRNVARGFLLARMNRPRQYLKRARRCRELRDEAQDNASRSQLATLERSYIMLAESSRVLRRSVRLQKALERRHRR